MQGIRSLCVNSLQWMQFPIDKCTLIIVGCNNQRQSFRFFLWWSVKLTITTVILLRVCYFQLLNLLTFLFNRPILLTTNDFKTSIIKLSNTILSSSDCFFTVLMYQTGFFQCDKIKNFTL